MRIGSENIKFDINEEILLISRDHRHMLLNNIFMYFFMEHVGTKPSKKGISRLKYEHLKEAGNENIIPVERLKGWYDECYELLYAESTDVGIESQEFRNVRQEYSIVAD
jgi:hypothetical protein